MSGWKCLPGRPNKWWVHNVNILVTLPLPASPPYFQLISSKLALSCFNWVYKLRSSMLVYILVLKVLNRRTLIKSLKPGKSQKFDKFEKFQYRHELISLKVIERIGYNLEYIIIDIEVTILLNLSFQCLQDIELWAAARNYECRYWRANQ